MIDLLPSSRLLLALGAAALWACSSQDDAVGQGPPGQDAPASAGGSGGAAGTRDDDPPTEEHGQAGAAIAGAAGVGGTLPIAGHPDAEGGSGGIGGGHPIAGNDDPGEVAGSGVAGSAAQGGFAGIAGGGGSAGIAGGGGSAGIAGAGGAEGNACQLQESGACTPLSAYACCRVKGGHYLWQPSQGCRQELSTPGGTAMCAQMSYTAPPDVNDPCTYFASMTCLQRDVAGQVELIHSTSYWTPAQLGDGWSTCSHETGEEVASLPACP